VCGGGVAEPAFSGSPESATGFVLVHLEVIWLQ
jgi:hypothetical protein